MKLLHMLVVGGSAWIGVGIVIWMTYSFIDVVRGKGMAAKRLILTWPFVPLAALVMFLVKEVERKPDL